jgi:hypothetical protein
LNKSVIGSVLIKELDLLTFFYLPILIYYYIITITTSTPNINKKHFLFLITPSISFVALLLNQFYFSLDIFKYIILKILFFFRAITRTTTVARTIARTIAVARTVASAAASTVAVASASAITNTTSITDARTITIT